MLKLKNKQLAISLLRPQGFTIVELLIVIVVIAILASISVVAYRGISDRANDTVVENDLAAITKTLELIKVNLGRYPRYSEEFTASNSFKFSKLAYDRSTHNAMYCINIDTDTYALGVRSKSGSSYMLVNGTTTKGLFTGADSVCIAAGAISWGASSVPHTAFHGFHPTGSPTSFTDGWNKFWPWTN